MTDIIDLSALDRLARAIGHDADVMRELFESFASEGEDMFDALQTAAAKQDWTAVKQEAHSLKGAAKDFGAREMARITAALEADAAGQAVPDCEARIVQARAAFREALGALEVLLNSGEFT